MANTAAFVHLPSLCTKVIPEAVAVLGGVLLEGGHHQRRLGSSYGKEMMLLATTALMGGEGEFQPSPTGQHSAAITVTTWRQRSGLPCFLCWHVNSTTSLCETQKGWTSSSPWQLFKFRVPLPVPSARIPTSLSPSWIRPGGLLLSHLLPSVNGKAVVSKSGRAAAL